MTEPNPAQLAKLTQQWQHQLATDYPSLDHELMATACEMLLKIEPQATPFAGSALEQGMQMTDVLLALNCNTNCLVATLCYPAFFYFDLKHETIQKKLNPSILQLLQGALRLEAINDFHAHSANLTAKQIENLRKMLLSMVDDIRVVLIKLAERLTILLNIKNSEHKQRYQIADQTMHLYAPLANRLGIGHIKWQLEDLSFRFTNPDDYFHISKSLKLRRAERETHIEQTKQKLAEILQASKIDPYDVSGRAKHIYSIFKKTQRKKVDISEIYDASAFRILVPNIKDCYTILSAIHATWTPIQIEFDDYIAKPKPNGYQSIHTAVIDEHKINIEIQIRTHKMHDAAELGLAAHWKYKEGAKESNYANKIDWLRSLLDWQQEISPTNEDNLQDKIFNDRIYIFSPNGEVFDLPQGATPLDFAYYVHTQVGNRCKGAQINGKLVPLTYQLTTGDQVDILTSKEDHPSRDWLNPNLGYITTSTAKNKIRHWFRQVDYQHHLHEGQPIWEKAARRLGFNKNDLNLIYEHFNFKKSDDLIAALGAGDISIVSISQKIRAIKQQDTIQPTEEYVISSTPQPITQPKSNILIEGESNLLTNFAQCCKPIFGDEIRGYITQGKGITIHKTTCPNLINSLKYRPERIINVCWGQSAEAHDYPVSIQLVGNDQPGIVRDMTSVLAENKLSLLDLHTHLNSKDNSVTINVTFKIKDTESLDKIINKLSQIAGISHIKRV